MESCAAECPLRVRSRAGRGKSWLYFVIERFLACQPIVEAWQRKRGPKPVVVLYRILSAVSRLRLDAVRKGASATRGSPAKCPRGTRDAMREVNAAIDETRKEHDPLASHIFVSRRVYQKKSDTKSGKWHHLSARLSWQQACDLGFRGNSRRCRLRRRLYSGGAASFLNYPTDTPRPRRPPSCCWCRAQWRCSSRE